MSKSLRTLDNPKAVSTVSASNSNAIATEMMFQKNNYVLFASGVALIVLGFLLMSGGNQPDANTWDDSTIYSFRRITLAPFTVIVGLCVVVYGIFKR
jgi:Protein of unknown function (DUF3098)